MNPLIQYFNEVDALRKEDILLLEENMKERTLRKGAYFLEIGQVCNSIGFVTDGIFRSAFVDEEGNESIRYFLSEGHFTVDLESYTNQTPAEECIDALTEARLLIMTRESMNLFAEKIPNFTKIINTIIQHALIAKFNLKNEMVSDDAPTRYRKLIERNPSIVQRVPLGIISSFLGITQFTLSRIRKNYR